jgi:hypothetical protein
MDTAFIELSAALTGFTRVELEGTGVSEDIWNELIEKEGSAKADALLKAWEQVKASSRSQEDALNDMVFSDKDLGPVAKTVIAAWYTGQWGNSAFDPDAVIISSQAYIEGLVWKAAKAHPMGAKQPGFGTWSFPLDGNEANES